ncbi:TetR/AcrR family transcriptional regulator [Herbaspirillum rhizosphaerae]|uniref:TetR/AcrR family transcriptional regulator n=1 Tax=Herbaspirillum rhizosphaerae TaxID=346179 RepID=A0ABW8Z407_9BURK
MDVIFEATIQVLLTLGSQSLNTTRVAERAGVSVGTLYQYFPNKHALMAALLKRYLEDLADTMEEACHRCRGKSLSDMISILINSYADVKIARPDLSRALYALSEQHDGAVVGRSIGLRLHAAMKSMFASCADYSFEGADIDTVLLLLRKTMSGTMQAILEVESSSVAIVRAREHLVLLAGAYLERVGKKIER